MKTTLLLHICALAFALSGCTTAPKKPAVETAKTEPLPVVDPFAPLTSEAKEYWEKRNADDRAEDEKERAQAQRRGDGVSRP
jgi:hypothetical protein